MEPFLQYEWLVAAAAAVSTGKRVFSAIEILKKKRKNGMYYYYVHEGYGGFW